ncbi:MAG: RidA family protein [Gammaproteobacteria bacterium]|nr:RidA family protein [Gammaproteobacteria bacterium]
MSITVVNPEGSQALYDQFHFSQAVKSGDLLLCSGQIGTEGRGSVPSDLATEFRNAFNAVGRVLAHAGLSFDDIVEYTTYHVGLQKTLPTFMQVRDEFIKAPWPAWTAIGISELAVPGGAPRGTGDRARQKVGGRDSPLRNDARFKRSARSACASTHAAGTNRPFFGVPRRPTHLDQA